MTDAYMERVKEKLSAGNAALVVLCDDYEVAATMAELNKAGGEAHGFGVSKKVLATVHNKRVQQYEESVDRQNDTTFYI